MLLPINRLLNCPVMSLQTGAELARTDEPIIDPRKMTIVAFYVEGRALDQHPSVLHVSDIRELSDIGMIIDDSEKLMPPDDLVRLLEVVGFGFKLPGIQVVDEHGRKLGKVSDYAIEPESYTIQQIYTEQSLLKSFSTVSNVIHRSQIVSVTNDRIIVSSPTVPGDAREAKVTSGFVNPFRTGGQPENQSSSLHSERS